MSQVEDLKGGTQAEIFDTTEDRKRAVEEMKRYKASGNKQAMINLLRSGRFDKNRVEIDLSGVDFSRCDLSGCILSFCNLQGANFTEANLDGCNLVFAQLQRAILDFTHMEGVYLREANLDNAKVIDCKISAVEDGKSISCQGTNFESSSFHGSNFEYGNFTGAVFKNVTFGILPALFANANFTNARFEDCKIYGGDFNNSNLKGVISTHGGADFVSVSLSGAHFDEKFGEQYTKALVASWRTAKNRGFKGEEPTVPMSDLWVK